MRGNTCKEGGGTPEGYVCVEDAKEARGLVLESGRCDVELPPGIVPPAAKTAEGIASMSVSR
jgi:hypothetical protein